MSAKKRGLGRGLDALLSSSKPAPSVSKDQDTPTVTETVQKAVEVNNSELQNCLSSFYTRVNINLVKTCLKRHLKN